VGLGRADETARAGRAARQLQVRLGLPETVSVTGGSGRWLREDGPCFPGGGSPVLDLSAEQVLRRRRCRQHALVWPKTRSCRRPRSAQSPRRHFSVEHGLIDLGAPPIRPTCRLIRPEQWSGNTVAATKRFRNDWECWLDAANPARTAWILPRGAAGGVCPCGNPDPHPAVAPSISGRPFGGRQRDCCRAGPRPGWRTLDR